MADERQSALGSTSKPSVVEHIPASSQRWQTKEKPSEEENIQRLFESIGHLSITDKAFALLPFTGAMNSSDQADKWEEKF
jgi:hypothetical protein